MEKQFLIRKNYLLIPVCVRKDLRCVSFFCGKEQIYGFRIPVHEDQGEFYQFNYHAALPVKQYIGKVLTVEGDVPETFLNAIGQSDSIPEVMQSRPMIHFTPDTGWINDPNGLIYHDGVYHLYFQHNPFNNEWENMSWGHAVSRDLLHWEQRETVLYPDGNGTIYSGSGIVNEKGLLNLPKDAHIYFYTCAGNKGEWSRGKTFTQRMAYSTDGGETLHRLEGCAVKHVVDENRDPKVYWHEESGAYYMVIYLDKFNFMILRSRDLKTWKKSQTLTLDRGFECPDLRKIPVEGGGYKWVFWSADGFYYLGDFDGYEFKTDGIRHEAYRTSIPYAAQTFWGPQDVITVPWLRTENKRKLYKSAMGLPRKLTLADTKHGLRLRQSHVKEFLDSRVSVYSSDGEGKIFHMMQKDSAVEICIHMEEPEQFALDLYGTSIIYTASCGKLSVGNESAEMGTNLNDFSIVADGEIVEVTADNGLVYAVFEIDRDVRKGTIRVETAGRSHVEIFRVD